MREMWFRAWHEYGKSVHPAKAGMIYDERPGDCLLWKNQRQKIVAIMQYTGLKDKNGKRIYEGDIIIIPQTLVRDYKKFVIAYHIDGFSLVRCSNYASLEFYASISEIAGNIYENPELVGGVDAWR